MKNSIVLATMSLAALTSAQLTSPTNAPACFGSGGPCNLLLNADLDCLALTAAPTSILASCACGAINHYMPSVTPVPSLVKTSIAFVVGGSKGKELTIVFSMSYGLSRRSLYI